MATKTNISITSLAGDLAWEKRLLRRAIDDAEFWGATKARAKEVHDWRRIVRATERELARARARRAAK